MNSVLLMVLAAVIVLGPLIAIHEFGHYCVARRVGVKVLTFSIGFGPAFLKWRNRHGTQFQIAAIPLGGYVRMADEREGEVPAEDLPRAFNNQPVWARMAIVAAGPLINLLFAVFLYWILFLMPTEVLKPVVGRVIADSPAAMAGLERGDEIVAIDGQPMRDWEAINYALIARMGESGQMRVAVHKQGDPVMAREVVLGFDHLLAGRDIDPFREIGFLPWQPLFEPVIGQVVAGSPAERQGLQVGDRILRVDGREVSTWQEFTDVVRLRPDLSLGVEVARGDEVLSLVLTPAGEKDGQGILRGKLGIAVSEQPYEIPPAYRQTLSYGPLAALGQAVEKTGKLIGFTLESLAKMLRGLISVDNLSGPITIAKVAGQSASLGWEALLGFMALLSISLGVLNLLPIPVLDGGHLVYHAIEGLTGKPLSERVQLIGLRIGVAMLMSLMLLAIFNDLSRL
ncbi:MAG: RIP metalloprotease RseP [Moraxellaceae bacterium]